jgi:hypothetical protein
VVSDDDLPSPRKPYLHVEPVVRRVSQATIDEKWTPLEVPAVDAASELLHLGHRPILQRMSGSEQRRTHTATALRLVTRRIIRKIDKGLPFPPASMAPARGGGTTTGATARLGGVMDGREVELDFESVLDGRAALERQLDPGLDAVEVLAREKQRMERELERDYETLRSLESGARAQSRQQRALLKKAHVLVPKSTVSRDGEQTGDAFRQGDGAAKRNVFTVSILTP